MPRPFVPRVPRGGVGVRQPSVDRKSARIRRNLVPTPNVEDAAIFTTYWARKTTLGTMTRDTTTAPSPLTASVKFVDVTGGTWNGVVLDFFPDLKIKPGTQYALSMFLKGAVGGESVSWNLAGGVYDNTSARNIQGGVNDAYNGAMTTAWKQFYLPFRTQVGGAALSFQEEYFLDLSFFGPNPSVSATWWVAGVMIEEYALGVSLPPAYFDGNQANLGAYWTGTTNNSESRVPVGYTVPVVTNPSITVTSSPSQSKISAQPGQDVFTFNWSSDQDFVAYQIRSVPSPSSPQTAGFLVEQNENPASGGFASTIYTATVTEAEIAAVDPSEGAKTIKVFVQNSSGLWST